MSITHRIKIDGHYARLIDNGEKTHECRYDDRDYQKGDVIVFCDVESGKDIPWMEQRTITHVLKNFPGVSGGWVVLSLNDPRRDRMRTYLDEAEERIAKRDRTVASLRGQITKLRNKVGGESR